MTDQQMTIGDLLSRMSRADLEELALRQAIELARTPLVVTDPKIDEAGIERRRRDGGPRVLLNSRYTTKCSACGQPIGRGTSCAWGRNVGIWHPVCSPVDLTKLDDRRSRKPQTAAEMERRRIARLRRQPAIA